MISDRQFLRLLEATNFSAELSNTNFNLVFIPNRGVATSSLLRVVCKGVLVSPEYNKITIVFIRFHLMPLFLKYHLTTIFTIEHSKPSELKTVHFKRPRPIMISN